MSSAVKAHVGKPMCIPLEDPDPGPDDDPRWQKLLRADLVGANVVALAFGAKVPYSGVFAFRA